MNMLIRDSGAKAGWENYCMVDEHMLIMGSDARGSWENYYMADEHMLIILVLKYRNKNSKIIYMNLLY
jgi:hypothetical protein